MKEEWAARGQPTCFVLGLFLYGMDHKCSCVLAIEFDSKK